MIAEALDPGDWITCTWSPSDLASMERREIVESIDLLQQDGRIPVLLVKDFGEFLMTSHGPWLERFLFGKVFEDAGDQLQSLRCVVVTHPRDREIVGSGSGLRERARHVHPPDRVPSRQEIASFGCTDAEELILVTGLNKFLLAVGGKTPDSRRGIARSIAQQRLPSWVAQLDVGHQYRLEDVLNRAQPPRWRQDEADPSLRPIVVPERSEEPPRCAIPESIGAEDLRQLLVGQPWPDRDLLASARRFCARCGNDPNPLWVDNYLSDTRQLDFARLVEFLELVVSALPTAKSIRLLSRDWIGGQSVDTAKIRTTLLDAGISSRLQRLLRWRLYDQRIHSNLHRRELILGSRRGSFSLPPARIVVGQDSASNETDSAVGFASSASTIEAWQGGFEVFNVFRSDI